MYQTWGSGQGLTPFRALRLQSEPARKAMVPRSSHRDVTIHSTISIENNSLDRERAADGPVARQFSDFKKFKEPFVRAAAEAFWQAALAEVLPGQKNHSKLRR